MAENDIPAVALLGDPVRRALYEWVAQAGRFVSRDEAATGVGIGRPLAAFHLDRLAADGLLDVEYRRLTGRSGPGAGRPAKLYRRASREIDVTLPERRYRVAAELLASAIERMAPAGPPEPLIEAAEQMGRDAAAEARAALEESGGGEQQRRAALLDVLARRGYEPVVSEAGEVRLRNCPFHVLAQGHRSVVCGMNLGIIRGTLEGLGRDPEDARLDPLPAFCCVVTEAGPGERAPES